MPKLIYKLSLLAILLFLPLFLLAKSRIPSDSCKPVVNRNYLSACIDLLDSAKKSIQISHFYFRNDTVTEKIKFSIFKALSNNVEISIILEDSMPYNKNSKFEFETLGAKTKLDSPDKKLHSKFIIVDGEYVLLGSTNFSSKSINENNETNLLIQNREIANIYQIYFHSIWNNEDFKTKIKMNSESSIVPLLGSNYFTKVKKMIDNSKNKIGVILYLAKYYDNNNEKSDQLLRSLINAKKRGVDVHVIIEKSSFDKELNEINRKTSEYLSEHNITAKFDTPDVITHAKLILADNKMVLGSRNWTKSGLEFNSESDILINDEETVNKFWTYFNNLKNSIGD